MRTTCGNFSRDLLLAAKRERRKSEKRQEAARRIRREHRRADRERRRACQVSGREDVLRNRLVVNPARPADAVRRVRRLPVRPELEQELAADAIVAQPRERAATRRRAGVVRAVLPVVRRIEPLRDLVGALLSVEPEVVARIARLVLCLDRRVVEPKFGSWMTRIAV